MNNAISLTDLRKSFGQMEIIRGVHLDIKKGERHAIIGPNGAGKSTLFHLISGHYQPSSGSVILNDEEIGGVMPYDIYRKGLARSFQVTNIFPNLTVYENVRCGALWACGHGYSFWQQVENLEDVNLKTEEILEKINLTQRYNVAASLLSYAEQRALEIGITLAGGAEVIMLDEPTAGMSIGETEQAVELIRSVTEDKTLVIVEHDMGVVFDLADRISVLVYGEIIATDTPTAIRSNKLVQEAYLGTEVHEDA
ncbi:MAG: ABC transporter ATP-binding protein [Alphaproteobacteria bacterium]|nr:ABC transporter ATP-binding protein [Alphaproteobacteria bacterium]